MFQFILRRLGLVIPTFIGITLLTFAFVYMIPGDPVMIMAGERGLSPERHAQLLAELGLDKPLWQQYVNYINGVLHGVWVFPLRAASRCGMRLCRASRSPSSWVSAR